MRSEPRKQTIIIHILSNISRNNDNQTKKYSQFVEHNLRNIFLPKIIHKIGFTK